MSSHPSGDIIAGHGTGLSGRRIALLMTGSVAVLRVVDAARLLMRHGARVQAVMSAGARRLIHPNLVEWATGHPVVTRLTGAIEHVALAGNVAAPVDLVLVAPATANTIGKIAAGIDDTPVTTVVTTAMGEGIPILVVPAMHEPMYRHPIVTDNIRRLTELGVRFLLPTIAEGKAKIASPEDILSATQGIIGAGAALAGYRVVVTVGRTVEYIDPIRVVTNNSTGKMGMAVAAAAANAGADVEVVYGKGTAPVPPGVRVRRANTAEDMLRETNAALADAVEDVGDARTVLIATAAVGDWKPRETASAKIPTSSSEVLTVHFVPTPKIIDAVKGRFPGLFLVAFRAQHDLEREALFADARARMGRAEADLIAVNDVSRDGVGFESDTNELFVLDPEGAVTPIPKADKAAVGRSLVALIADRLIRREGEGV